MKLSIGAPALIGQRQDALVVPLVVLSRETVGYINWLEFVMNGHYEAAP